jgi:hypothetical protein
MSLRIGSVESSVVRITSISAFPRRSLDHALSAAPLFPLRVYGILVLALESSSDLSLASSGPLAGAAFFFIWRLKHSNTYDQARARASRAWPKEMSQSGRWEECLLVIKHFVRALELARTGAYAQALEEGNVEV